jgi:uncharacterized protein YfkK (UPF0435 family)
MHRGYVKVWRKIIDAGWLQNHKLCSLWLWCLIKASHKEFDAIVGCQTVHLMPGEFVFGLKAASKELKISIQSIRTLLDFLKTSQNLTIKSTNKFSIVSVVNWNTYQAEENEINTQTNKPLTNHQQTTNNKQTQEEHKHKKNIINKEIILPEKIKKETWEAYLEMRKVIKKPATLHAQQLTINKLLKIGGDLNAILENSIQNSYQGVFAPKIDGGGNGNKPTTFKPNNRELSKDESDAYDAITREYEIAKASGSLANN